MKQDVRNKQRRDNRRGDERGDRNGLPILPVPPQAVPRRSEDDAEPDEQSDEHGVVGARESLCAHGRPQGNATRGRRLVDEPMEGQQAERNARGHQQLNVRQMAERVGTVCEGDGSDD